MPERATPACASRATCDPLRIPDFSRSGSGSRKRTGTTEPSWWSSCMRRPSERGVALVAVVAATALWTVVAVGLAATAATGDRLASRGLAAAQAEALARSGVAAGRAALADATALDVPDTLQAPWARPLEPYAIGSGTVRVEVEDEGRRLDVNTMPDALPVLLARIGLDPLLADAVADWIDPDDVRRAHGAERPSYQALVPPRVAANR